jgi:hypothetical protein
MIYVEDELLPPIYFQDPKTGVEDKDSYFVIRRELPNDAYMAYLDAAISYELQPIEAEEGEVLSEEDKGKKELRSTSNKLTATRVQDILVSAGLVEIVGVKDRKSDQPITAREWHRLPTPMILQITTALQTTATTKLPN